LDAGAQLLAENEEWKQFSMNINMKVPQWNTPKKGGNCLAPEIVI
jgi:hypothetical protein